MKKFLNLSFLAFLLSFSGFAYSSFDYYVGGAAGVTLNSAEIKQRFDISVKNTSQPFDDILLTSLDSDSFHPEGQLQIGGGFRNKYFYLGAELSGQFFDGDFDTLNTEFFANQPQTLQGAKKTELRLRSFEPALDLKPGIFFFKKTLLYARIGIAINRLEINEHSYMTHQGVSLNASKTESKDVYPLRLGLGVERHFTEDMTIGMDYIYTNYGDISVNGFASGTLSDLDTSLTTQSEGTSVFRQAIMLRLNYYL